MATAIIPTTNMATARKRIYWKPITLLLLTLLVLGGGFKLSQVISDIWTRNLSSVKILTNQVVSLGDAQQTLRLELEELKRRLTPTSDHQHLYPEGWSQPKQIEGPFPIPHFFQERRCVVCGQGQVRLAN